MSEIPKPREVRGDKWPWHDPLKPARLGLDVWLTALAEKRVLATRSMDVHRLALAFTIAEASDSAQVTRSGVSDLADRWGMKASTLNQLRVASHQPVYTQVSEIRDDPKFGKLLEGNEIHVMRLLVTGVVEPRHVPPNGHPRVIILNRGDMYLTRKSPAVRPLAPYQREHLEQAVTYGVMQLATGMTHPVPFERSVRPAPDVDWERVLRAVTHGMGVAPSHRDMIRSAMPPEVGAVLTNADIRARVRERYGAAAPDAHALNMAIRALCVRDELRRVSPGRYAATPLLRASGGGR